MRKQRWTVEERQTFQDGDRLKASSIPPADPTGPQVEDWGDVWGDDSDVPLLCGIENPESCESCG